MKNWKIPPKHPTVAQFIDCYWLLEKSLSDAGVEHPKLNPDPAGHLIVCSNQQNYQYTLDTELFTDQGCHLIYPHRQTITMDHSQPFLIVGIKFRIGALYALKLPAEMPLIDQVHPANIETPFSLGTFCDKGFAPYVDHPEPCRDVLDTALAPWLNGIVEDAHSQLVRRALQISPSTPISDMGTVLGCSQRTVERRFLRVTGFTLKQFHSMERLEAMLDYLHTRGAQDIQWVDVALAFGFSDQPHLVRYLKDSIGQTPGQYAKHRNLTIDVYGNFE